MPSQPISARPRDALAVVERDRDAVAVLLEAVDRRLVSSVIRLLLWQACRNTPWMSARWVTA